MIPNFSQFSTNLWRGGQPHGQDWDTLRTFGITTVVKLNLESEGSDAKAVELGMNMVTCPINLWQETIGEPDLTRLVEIVMSIQPFTLIHCTHGSDRTGLLVGIYRVWREGWAVRRAWEEMQSWRFHRMLFGLDKAWFDLTRQFYSPSPNHAAIPVQAR